MIIYIYDRDSLQILKELEVELPSLWEFNLSPNTHYPDFNLDTMIASEKKFAHPKIVNNEIVSKNYIELVKEGILNLPYGKILVDDNIVDVKLDEYTYIEDNVVKFNREKKKEFLKNELDRIKLEKIEKGVEVVDGIFHPARDTDKINLTVALDLIGEGTMKWKCYDNEHNTVLLTLNKQEMESIRTKGILLLSDLILGEEYAIKLMDKLSDEELKLITVEQLYERGKKLINKE